MTFFTATYVPSDVGDNTILVDQNSYSDLAGNGNIKSSPFIWRYEILLLHKFLM
ncbi:hypothetical protein CM15mP37_11640 [bacterium]|nr:MAG: hypothetical protein CM15mP37_11640 [bacterium]